MRTTVEREGFAFGSMPSVEAMNILIQTCLPNISFGDPATLRPRQAEHAPSGSLSGRFGLGRFPFHIDGARYRSPPRYVVLFCAEANSGAPATNLVDWSLELERPLLEAATETTVSVNNGCRSFYDTLLSRNWSLLRWNPLTVAAVDERGTDVLSKLSAALSSETSRTFQVCWSAGDFAVIDNWRILHDRDSCSATSSRTLTRWWGRDGAAT